MMTNMTDDKAFPTVTPVLNTGVGPNLVPKDALLTLFLANVQPARASKRVAGDTKFRAEGVIYFTIKIRRHKPSIVSGVALKLTTKMILETAFIV